MRSLKRVIEANPTDWDPLTTRLFLKSQAVKKLEKLGGVAAPGQIVATFPLAKTLRDSVWALYLERLLLRDCRPTTYLHCRTTFSDMTTFYKRFWQKGPTTANDYTAWDSGCDALFLNFDCWLMTTYGIPKPYVEQYFHERCNTSAYVGPMPIMQFSGDRWTWLLNTARNAALTGWSLNCPAATPAAFSGDDSVVLGAWGKASDFRPSAVRMTPKRVVADTNTFCGYLFGMDELCVSPVVVLARARIGFEDGRRDESFWDSIDLACRYTSVNAVCGSETTTAYALSCSARRMYGLPPSRFPLLPKPVFLDTPGFKYVPPHLRRARVTVVSV